MSEGISRTDIERAKKTARGLGKYVALVAAVAILLWIGFQSIDSNDADSTIVLQKITGDLKVLTEPGPYLRLFGTPHVYKKVIAVNFTGDRDVTAASILRKIPVRFVDTSLGDASGVVRIRLPTSDADMVKIHREFGSQQNLTSNLLERFVIEAAKSATRLMSVEEHYSGGAGQLSLDFEDQLQNGIFVTEQVIEDVRDGGAQSREEQQSTETSLRRQERVTVRKKKVDDKGNYVRTSNPMLDYKITVISGSVQDVDYEQKVDERLTAQKQAAADEALARQNLKKAQQEAKTARALGEKAIAEARARAEKEKLEAEIRALKEASVARINAEREKEVALIQAARRVAEAKQKRSEAEQNKLTAKEEAEALTTLAKAREEAKESVLDPSMVFKLKMKTYLEAQKVWANAFAKRKVPQMVFGGNASNNEGVLTNDASLTQAIINAMLVKQLGIDPFVTPRGDQ